MRLSGHASRWARRSLEPDQAYGACTPRLIRLSRNARQWTSASDSATETPSTRRWPVAAGRDTHGHQHGAVHYLAGFPYTLVARIEQQVRRFFQRTIAPGVKASIELLRAATDLGGRDAVHVKLSVLDAKTVHQLADQPCNPTVRPNLAAPTWISAEKNR